MTDHTQAGRPQADDAGRHTEHIRTETRGALGIITLDRPRALNSLDRPMVLALERALLRWAEAPEVRAVVVRGEGRGLCAGGDVRALREGPDEDAMAFWADEYRLNALIAAYPKPYVALMDGITMGGGLGISAHGSVRVVTERTAVAMPETRIGFTPDVGMAKLLAAAPGKLGTHLALTAQTATGADAVLLGWADHLVPSERLGERGENLIGALAAGFGRADAADASGAPALAVAHDAVRSLALDAADPALVAPLAAERSWIDEAYVGPGAPAILAQLEALAAEGTEGAHAAAAEALREVCPFSVVLTLEALRRAALMDLGEVLAQDLRLGAALIRRGDMREGIRALLVDKDGAPRWSPARIEDVDPAEVEAAFGG
ncbi:enoyl-CoA hydratase/isomerase family protein [Sinomonas halotolerans]|uniref:3-hydroxyisobutyryl-CoA hydrolase n=1 Tax=Sinomonas halotolerans TaxID=1644133 RepID=A0ABU9X3E4_9MICC